MGYTAISGYLNRNGYTRPPAKNAIRPSYGEWSSDHIKRMLSNPVYTGRVAWGKRRTEKVPGKDNEYRLVKQDEYILSEVISHEAFVSKEDFDKVQEIKAIRGKSGKKGNHNIGQYNAHLLSGIVKCPQCGAPMYIGMTKWTNQDGTERRTESYVCSYATKHRGTSVCRRNGVVASQVEDEVMEYTRKIVRNPQFIKDLQEKVMTAVDMTEVETDITAYKNQLSALQRSRDSLERDIDRIAPDDKYAERRRADMTRRLNDLYDQIYKAEDLLQESMMKKATLESEQMSVQSMIGILSSFDAIYDRMNAAERRDLVKYLISEVELFPREEQKTQKRFVKAIAYKFPIEQKVLTQFDECGASVETVCLLSKLNAKQHIEVEVKMDELDLTAAESKATYEKIKAYVLEHSGMKVSSLYIAQVKQKRGIIERENYNKPKSDDARQPQCPPEKEKVIMEAFEYFGMI